MQEKEKQGANPFENEVLLYSGKQRVSEDRKDLLAHSGESVLAEPGDVSSTVCFGITEAFLSFLRGLLPHGWAVAAAQFHVPAQFQVAAHSCLPPQQQDTRCLGSGSEAAHGLLLVWRLNDLDAFLLGLGI